MNLVVGAGLRRVDDYTHHDVVALEGIDLVCDMWDLPKHIKPGTVEKMQATHVLEHFPMAKTAELFEMLNTLLVPGGEIYIEVPNFLWHASQIIQDPTNRQIVQYAFGGQLDKWDYHYNGFTPQILREDLEFSGFKVTELNNYSSIECRAVKL